jgi:hypothetical protein
MGPFDCFVEWLKVQKITPEWREDIQVSSVIRRYKKFFNDIVIVDFQNEVQSLSAEFYCDGVPGATETCKIAKSKQQKGSSITANKGSSLEYVRLVYDARFQGLIPKDVTYKDAEASVKRYMKGKGMTLSDLPHYCLQDDLEEALFQMTLAEERELMPHLFKRSDAVAKLRDDFNEYIKAGSLCSIDVPEILQQQEWIDFLGGLKPVVHVSSQ